METMWYYAASDQERKGPVAESELRALLASGQLQPDDMVWRDGMAAWSPLRNVPELHSAPAVPDLSQRVPVPAGLTGWMAFNGIVIILSGVTYVLSCFALPSGILLILAGASLMSAQSMLTGLRTVDPGMLPFLQKLRGFFLMTGVATLVAIVLTLLMLILAFGMGVAMFSTLFETFAQP